MADEPVMKARQVSYQAIDEAYVGRDAFQNKKGFPGAEVVDSVGSELSTRQEARPPAIMAIAYGLVASAMCAPVMMSFASIIFGDPTFSAYMPSLVKLVLFSAAVHQICYVLRSTLPFAVGQVQDAGLIFLSAMARRVVTETEIMNDAGLTTAAALWILALATAFLGFMLMLIGRCRLASLAQYLPVPVVGGYLAYIAFYCGQAGLAMMAQVELVKLRDWHRLYNKDACIHIVPGLVVAALIKSIDLIAAKRNASRTVRALVIPGVLLITVAVFYFVLLATGSTLQDARDYGWVGATPNHASTAKDVNATPAGWRSIPFLEPWTLYFPEEGGHRVMRAVISIAPKLVITWIGMVLVVAFSSSLDIAAIEMELHRPLSYDQELAETVGFGNVVSGLLGGYSGSYIFSQTILNLRSGVADRRSGVTVALAELALVFLLPVPPTALVPIAAFGGTLVIICIELGDEWLLRARRRFSNSEYAVLLFSFIAIHVLGLEAGFTAGLVAAALAFAAKSAGTSSGEGAVTCGPARATRSVVMRDFEQRAVLSDASRRGTIEALELRGFVWFAAAAELLVDMQKRLRLSYTSKKSTPKDELDSSLYARLVRRRAKPRNSSHRVKLPPPRCLVLDCSNFNGVDATAARACFLPLLRQLAEAKSQVFFAGLRQHVKLTLTNHGVELENSQCFSTLDSALERAEDLLLKSELPTFTSFNKRSPLDRMDQYAHKQNSNTSIFTSISAAASKNSPLSGLTPRFTYSDDEKEGSDNANSGDPLVEILCEYLFASETSPQYVLIASGISSPPEKSRSLSSESLQNLAPEDLALAAMLKRDQSKLTSYFHRASFPADATLYTAGEAGDRLFIIASGIVDFFCEIASDSQTEIMTTTITTSAIGPTAPRRLMRVTRGGVVGELSFFLRRPQRVAARTAEPTEVFVLDRTAADTMRADDPDLYIVLQTALLKNLCLQVEDSLGSFLFRP